MTVYGAVMRTIITHIFIAFGSSAFGRTRVSVVCTEVLKGMVDNCLPATHLKKLFDVFVFTVHPKASKTAYTSGIGYLVTRFRRNLLKSLLHHGLLHSLRMFEKPDKEIAVLSEIRDSYCTYYTHVKPSCVSTAPDTSGGYVRMSHVDVIRKMMKCNGDDNGYSRRV